MRIRRQAKQNLTIPLASTADIAFLLLVFFIVLAKATKESSVQVKPPTSPQQMVDARDAQASVIIDKDSNIFVNGLAADLYSLRDAVAVHLENIPQQRRKIALKIDASAEARIFEEAIYEMSDLDAQIIRILDKPSADVKQ